MLLHALSVLISSFLLFQIQPLMAKYILPWFGGTSNVWSASLLFFQITLTAGYAYSSWLVNRISARKQGLIHLIVLGASIAVIAIHAISWNTPILPEMASWNPGVNNPLAVVSTVLFVSIGIPYFLLSSNSTLMQAWFVNINPKRSPYFLYSISNIGSLLGLASYPFLIEPLFSIKFQSSLWTFNYLVYVFVVGFHSWGFMTRTQSPIKGELHAESQDGQDLKTYQIRGSWIILPALASILLLATTNRITQEIAAIPFLWVIPFFVYLLSFIITFTKEAYYSRWFWVLILISLTIIDIWFVEASTTNILVQIGVSVAMLYVCSMICHGELFRSRPESSHLTKFYLLTSIGGALGGIFVNLIFPRILSGFWEFQIGLGCVWLFLFYKIQNFPKQGYLIIHRGAVFSTGFITCLVFGSLYLNVNKFNEEAIITSRNFYGVLTVKELSENDPKNHRFVLSHGITTHGFQFLSPAKNDLPTSYYTEESGVGLSFRYHPSRPDQLRVGIIGLGAGVLASYGQPGDHFTFYEINPAVVEIAESEYFSYLQNSDAFIEILLGDGRKLLENEMIENGSNLYDLLIIDAFNSDSIPTHLLTKEAVDIYLKHLNPDGLLAFHISNRFLNLGPIVWNLADAVNWKGITIFDKTKNERISPSRWIILTNNQNFLTNTNVLKHQSPDVRNDDLRMWTDNYSNLFLILK